jgi:hypothetical protein
MKRTLIPLLVLSGTGTVLFAACYVNGPARECPATVYHNGGTCNFIRGVIPWVSEAPPGVSGRTLPCATPPQCVYTCPHLGGEEVRYYTGAVVTSCGDPCTGVPSGGGGGN